VHHHTWGLHWRRCHHESSRHADVPSLLTRVHALVVIKVDYCSSVLVGPISGQLLQRLQSVFNAAARLVFSARKSEHITTLLPELLAESSRENSVPVMCSRVSLPYRHGAVIPCWDPPLNCRRRFTSTSPECFSVDAGHTDHTTHHGGWSSLPGDYCSSVECSFVVCSFCAIAAAVLPRPQESRRHCFSHRTHSVQLYDRLYLLIL